MKRFLAGSVAALALVIFAPGSASANTVLPSQILPPGQNACAAITLSDIQAHVYNGSLDSFDFTVSDPSYVAIAASAGDVSVPFYFMTRWANADGSLRMHVDMPESPRGPDVTIRVTLLAALKDSTGASQTCAYSLSGLVTGIMAPTPYVPIVSYEYPSDTVTTMPPPVITEGDKGGDIGGIQGTTSSTTTVPQIETTGAVTATNALNNLCLVGGASKLWAILLVLYLIFVLTLVLQKFDEASLYSREWNVALILAIFVGLLLFWYVSAQCRTGSWAPALATLIAIVGLIATMLKPEIQHQILLLKEPRK
ncbi:hypothetical protein HY968_04795 [Candidatus Kaiserbacteria bacterium]|nr:hypothetical protein [Candidatus Kaiserbacteria bacterium]